ncbi:MAG: PAS domain S-box protein [Acidobacteria bacterium]|nr:PAS domain S-box protein [Acidobacteriota bacterium]
MESLLLFPQSLLLAVAVLVPAAFVVWLLRNQLRDEKTRGFDGIRRVEAAALDPTFRVSAGGIVVAFNMAAERLFGYAPKEVIGQHVGMLLPAAAGTATTLGWNALPGVRRTENGLGVEVNGKRKDGTYVPLDLRFTEVPETGGRLFVCTARDLTERVQLQRLAKEAELMGGLLHSVGAPIVVLDREGRIVRTNPAFLELTGYPQTELETRYFYELLLANGEWTRGKVAVAQVISGNAIDKGAYHWKLASGKTAAVLSVMTAMQGSNGRPEYAILTAMEAPAAANGQGPSLDALERLAGGVAHQFNELLTSIQGYSELVLHGMEDGDPLRRDVQEIKKASDRAAALTSQLLVFSRKQPLRTSIFNLNDLIHEMKPMIGMLLGEQVQVSTMLDLELGQLRADAGWIEQVILNLVVNARDAMPNGGKLTIETGNASLDAATARRTAQLSEGEYLLLSVADSGKGMDAATRQHLFEPYYTTKRTKGAGLGLSTVYGAVRQAGGNVVVQSVPDQGTTVRIYLPRFTEAEQPERAKGLFLVRGASAGH